MLITTMQFFFANRLFLNDNYPYSFFILLNAHSTGNISLDRQWIQEGQRVAKGVITFERGKEFYFFLNVLYSEYTYPSFKEYNYILSIDLLHENANFT